MSAAKDDEHSSSVVYEDYDVDDTFLAAGKCGIIYALDDERVLKEYHGEPEEPEVELRALRRLSPHPNIVRLLDVRSDGSIILERGQPLRNLLQQTNTNPIPLSTKVDWLKHAAEGIRHMHLNGIIQADVSCGNMILVHSHVKIIDFEGCSIDGEAATSGYEWFSSTSLSLLGPNQQTDIFAFGCAIYEILTGRPPYHELVVTVHNYDLAKHVRKLYAENRFPEVENLPLSDVIRGCWYGAFVSMGEVAQAIDAASTLMTST